MTSDTKNKNMRAMAWIGFLHAIATTTYAMLAGKELPPDYYYLFITGVISAYFGFSKWGEINDAKHD